AVMGGAAKIHDGAHVHGDATAVGGAITIEDGAHVDGETHVIGGAVRRGDRAVVGARSERGHKARRDDGDDDDDDGAPLWRRAVSRIGSGITRTALLFVFGSMLLALAAPRMEQLQVEIVGRPMRTFALGVLGVLASLVLFVALCVTLIGIPIAI